MITVRKFLEKINIVDGEMVKIRFDEPLSSHTTFKVGGPAAAWVQPLGEAASATAARLLAAAATAGLPYFILGGGANVVFADTGFPGLVLDTAGLDGYRFTDHDGRWLVEAGSGMAIDAVAEACADRGLDGLAFLAGMPGTVGGAVWMNARCYGAEVADSLESTSIMDESYERRLVPFEKADFGYKRSPFQRRRVLIVAAVFRLAESNPTELRRRMAAIREDRSAKGHYRLPSAGSAFKNDYDFGLPTGRIVDELGLRGTQIGGARVADWHGNIIVNTGGATARDIRALMDLVAARVLEARGLRLEPEILFIGA